MTRLLLNAILFLTLTFTAFSLAARALGSTQPPNPALEGFTVGCEGKPQPCWYGIVPGVTTMEEAKTLIDSAGGQVHLPEGFTNIDAVFSPFQSLCPLVSIHPVNGVVMVIITIYSCSGTDLQAGNDHVFAEIPNSIFAISGLSSAHGLISSSQSTNRYGWWSPFERLVALVVHSSGIQIILETQHGLIQRRRTCQLEPNYFDCH